MGYVLMFSPLSLFSFNVQRKEDSEEFIEEVGYLCGNE
jgi:hypothetical protein